MCLKFKDIFHLLIMNVTLNVPPFCLLLVPSSSMDPLRECSFITWILSHNRDTKWIINQVYWYQWYHDIIYGYCLNGITSNSTTVGWASRERAAFIEKALQRQKLFKESTNVIKRWTIMEQYVWRVLMFFTFDAYSWDFHRLPGQLQWGVLACKPKYPVH